MRLLTALCFASATVLAATAYAQQPAHAPAEEEHRRLAREYLEVGGAEDMFLEGVKYGFREAARAQGIEFTPAQRDRINTLLMAHHQRAAQVFVDHLVNYYVAHSTTEDLNAALAFYRRAEGSRYVGALLTLTFPLSTHLATGGRVPLAPIDVAGAGADELERGSELADLFMAQMHEAERIGLDSLPIGRDGVRDFVARSFAVSLTVADMWAAIQWFSSEPSRRLEGPSAERTLNMQSAIALSSREVDADALQQDIARELANTPT
jgi:hypothetical protein